MPLFHAFLVLFLRVLVVAPCSFGRIVFSLLRYSLTPVLFSAGNKKCVGVVIFPIRPSTVEYLDDTTFASYSCVHVCSLSYLTLFSPWFLVWLSSNHLFCNVHPSGHSVHAFSLYLSYSYPLTKLQCWFHCICTVYNEGADSFWLLSKPFPSCHSVLRL